LTTRWVTGTIFLGLNRVGNAMPGSVWRRREIISRGHNGRSGPLGGSGGSNSIPCAQVITPGVGACGVGSVKAGDRKLANHPNSIAVVIARAIAASSSMGSPAACFAPSFHLSGLWGLERDDRLACIRGVLGISGTCRRMALKRMTALPSVRTACG
jgi:hypothetical protein